MSTMKRNSPSTKAIAVLMSCLLVISTFASFAAGGGKAFAEPAPYTPITEESPDYAGALTWMDYTPPLSPGSVTEAVYVPFSLDMDGDDNIYMVKVNTLLSESENSDSEIVKLTNGGHTSTELTYGFDFGFAFDIDVDKDGNVYVADNSTIISDSSDSPNVARILMLKKGTSSWDDITEDIAPALPMTYATSVAVDPDGNVYVVDSNYDNSSADAHIFKLSQDTDGAWTWTEIEETPSTNTSPFGIAIDGEGNIFVNELPDEGLGGSGKIFRLSASTATWGEVTPTIPLVALGLGVDKFDNVLALNLINSSVMKLGYGDGSEDWKVVEVTNPEFGYSGIAADSSGYLYMASYSRGNVKKLMAGLLYNGNGQSTGTAPVDPVGYEPDVTAVVYGNTGNLAKINNVFEGWNTESDGTGTSYAPGDSIDMTHTVMLYAVWSPVPSYTVTYQAAAGGSLTGLGSETVTSGSSPASVPAVTPDLGYTFLGWSSDGGTTLLTADQLASTAVTANVTYTAYFQPPVALTGITLDSAGYSLSIGDTHETVVTAVYSDHSTRALSSGVSYSSSKPAFATVDSTGLVTAVASGQTVITAEYEGQQAQATVTVTSSSSSNDSDEETAPVVEVIVDGVKQDQLATAKQDKVDGRTIITVTLDSQKVIDKMARDDNKLLTIPLNGDNHAVIGQLTGSLVKALESNAAQIQIVTNRATYTLPASQINIDSINAQIGDGVKLEDITVRIQISETSDDKTAEVQTAAERNQFKTVVHPVDFEISASYGSQTVQANKFNSYVERLIALPEGMTAEDVTTGVVLTADGELFHVPTVVVQRDGITYALINSLTNSTYSVIYNPREMDDVKDHWAKADVNDMSSRLIIQGVTATEFRPDAPITRAEFAAIVTRALGIQGAAHAGTFTDVGATSWYASAVQAAVNYKLIDGYTDGTFRPDRNISRQEAAVVLSRAAGIASLKSELSAEEITRILSAFTDGSDAAGWASKSVASAISLGLMKGRGLTLDLNANLTRAETAALIRRFLQTGTLINS